MSSLRAARPSRVRIALGVTAGLVAVLIYAGQFVVSRWSMQRTLSVWDLAALRFSVAGFLMLPLVIRYGWSTGAGVGWGRAVVLAIAAGAPYTLILYAGLAAAPAAHGAVIVPGSTPVISTLVGWWWLGERPSAVKFAGLVVVTVGLVLVSWPGITGSGGDLVWKGDVLFAAAGLLWALYTVLARHWHVDPMRSTAMVWVIGLAYVPVYVGAAGTRLLDAPRGEIVFQAIYQGLFVAVVALALYAWSIRVLGVSMASLFMPLVPVFGVLLAIPVLAEIPAAVQLIGMLAVSVGMMVAARRG